MEESCNNASVSIFSSLSTLLKAISISTSDCHLMNCSVMIYAIMMWDGHCWFWWNPACFDLILLPKIWSSLSRMSPVRILLEINRSMIPYQLPHWEKSPFLGSFTRYLCFQFAESSSCLHIFCRRDAVLPHSQILAILQSHWWLWWFVWWAGIHIRLFGSIWWRWLVLRNDLCIIGDDLIIIGLLGLVFFLWHFFLFQYLNFLKIY